MVVENAELLSKLGDQISQQRVRRFLTDMADGRRYRFKWRMRKYPFENSNKKWSIKTIHRNIFVDASCRELQV
jgi:hypothetical protein